MHTRLGKPVQRAGMDIAIGVDDHDQLRSPLLEVPNAMVQCVAFAAQREVVALDHLCTEVHRHCRGVVAAVVRDDQETIGGTQLSSDGPDRDGDACRLVVCRNEHGQSGSPDRGRPDSATQVSGRADLDEQHDAGNQQQQRRCRQR